jgi:transcription elongation factor Elf1
VIRCENCKRTFALTRAEERRVAAGRAKGQTVFAFTCPHCGLGTLSGPRAKPGPTYRCPEQGCAGWVVLVDAPRRKAFWGCGGCGTQWSSRASLFTAIAAIVVAFPHRRRSYRKVAGGGWAPQPLSREHPRYEETVEAEPSQKKGAASGHMPGAIRPLDMKPGPAASPSR